MRVSLPAVGLIVATGCMSTETIGDDNGDPNACAESVMLDGSAPRTMPSSIGPLGPGSTNICMRLDASHNLVSGHLIASTEAEPGSSSSFGTVMTEIDGTVIVAGSDVTFGQAEPMTRSTLEWSIPAGEVHDVVLRLTARGASAPTTVLVSLFEPFE